eukprot:3093154-Rhodomonas_salina.1
MFPSEELRVSPIPCSAVGSKSPAETELLTRRFVTPRAFVVADIDMSRRAPTVVFTMHSPAIADRRAAANPATSAGFITTFAAASPKSVIISSLV